MRYFFICFTPLLTPFAVLLAFVILSPFEEINNKNYIIRAKRKLSKYPDLIKIGITGSYGKTSVKNILHTMLSQKYNTLSTPGSYNTPMGLTKTILKQLNPSHEIFIAEMGARTKGDIKYICDFVKPDIGIITAIGNQHFESFRTLGNLMDTKYELIEGLSGRYFAAFNCDSAPAADLYNKCPSEKIYTKTNDANSFVVCKNISSSENGITFDLYYNGAFVNCSSKLIGAHNVSNILISAAVAVKLGITLEMIKKAISELEPVPHRLQLLKNNGINIIDDSFNASVEGCAAATEALSVFKGRKIAVTPGLIELGEIEQRENRRFGEQLAAVCDMVILVGENHTKPIYEGLISKAFDEKNIFVVNSLEEAKTILSKTLKAGDTVLFENDLPDSYSEQ
jgi:UDP-N-acetylmuramoyl-tripeptide--D-alanyl-D-alanine ligase